MTNNILKIKLELQEDLPSLLATLLGDRKLSTLTRDYRIGNNGSLCIRKDGLWYCHESGAGGDILDLIVFTQATDFKGALTFAKTHLGQPRKAMLILSPPANLGKVRVANRERQRAKATWLWRQSQHINASGRHGSLVKKYLAERSLHPEPWPSDLCFYGRAENFTTSKKHPALIAAVRDKAGDVVAVHQTFLTEDGRKISGDGVKAKLFLGAVKGGAIRLTPATERVALAEGIEDALSVIQSTGWPCWATGSASNIPELPCSIREVMICADNDAAGRKAAERMAAHYAREGRSVRIALPPAGAKDWNEALQKEKAALAGAASNKESCV